MSQEPGWIAPPIAIPSPVTYVADRLTPAVDRFFEQEIARWGAINPVFEKPLEELWKFVELGGKRLRPSFCYWACVGAGGDGEDEHLWTSLLGLELLHSFALIHDDVMDSSEIRRGEPTLHMRFARMHGGATWSGDAHQFGEAAAVLVGDLAFALADRLFEGASREVRAIFDDLKVEVNLGQYLDILGSAIDAQDISLVEQVAVFKSGKYTVERPMHIGAALAGRFVELSGPISRFALPLGLAFQLRDDLLGVFGDTSETMKPVGDDLREGKATLLITMVRKNLPADERVRFESRFGRRDATEHDIGLLQEVIAATSAPAQIERRVADLRDEALGALKDLALSSEAKEALTQMADFVAERRT